MTGRDVEAFARCLREGGVAVFPADTVYGLACDPDDAGAVRRLYALKRRAAAKPAAVMFFDVELARAALPELGSDTAGALWRLLPWGVTVLLSNPGGRFPLACGPDPATLGVRVPRLEGALAPLAGVRQPVLQSSANRAGGPDPARVEDVPAEILCGVDVVLHGGQLPGTPSTVVDLRGYEHGGEWSLLREGALPSADVEAVLAGGRRSRCYGRRAP